jgi:hypothetical protein
LFKVRSQLQKLHWKLHNTLCVNDEKGIHLWVLFFCLNLGVQPKPMNPQDFGTYVEYLFAIKCIENGYKVSFPLHSHSEYDCIVDVGDRLYKVQVKGSRQEINEEGNVKVQISNRKQLAYLEEDVDFMAVYVSQYNGFFIVPVNGNKTIRLSRKNKNAKYFDNFAFDFS